MVMQPAARPVRWLHNRTLVAVIAAGAVILALTLGMPLARNSLRAQQPQPWIQLSSPFDGTINALLVEDPSGVRIMYAGTEGGVFRSIDQGKTWTACNKGLSDRLVRSLAMDPDNPNVLYAGTWSGRVYLSMDAGGNWHERSGNLPRSEILALAVHSHEPRRLYALTAWGVFVTADQGLQWSSAGEVTDALAVRPTGEAKDTLQCMAVNTEQPNMLYVGTTTAIAETGICVSTDGGTSWRSLRTGWMWPTSAAFSDVSALVLVPRIPGTVYALGQSSDGKRKLFKSEDWGTSWRYVDSYRDDAIPRCIAVNPRNPLEVYVGLQDGLYKSTDGRQSWSRSQKGLTGPDEPAVDVSIVVVDPLETSTVYACSGNQLFISEDAGTTWELRSTIRAADEASILALAADPKSRQTFYASVDGGGLYKTTDGGNHWQHVGKTFPAQHMTAIEVDPVNTQIVYVGHREGAVSRSVDGGITLPVTQTVPVAQVPITISVVAVDPERPGGIYAGTAGQGLFRSNDGGVTWTAIDNGIGRDIRRLVVNSKERTTALYARDEKTVWRSYNGGESWRSWQPELLSWADIAPPVKSSVQPFLVSEIPTISVSIDVLIQTEGQGGATVAQSAVTILSQPPGTQQAELIALAASPATPEALYALVQGQGVLSKTHASAQWTTLGPGLESLQLQALALSPDDPNLILVGTEKGVYRYQPERPGSRDLRERWQDLVDTLKRWVQSVR